MKKLIVDFGVEKIAILKVDIKGKEIKVLEGETLESGGYYSDGGTLDIKKLASDIKSKFGKEAANLDMEIVLPDYMTKTQYKETERMEGLKPDDIREPYNSKMSDKLIAFIGDNGSESTTQIVFYNKQQLKNFLREMYKANLNVVNAISNYTAYQNSIPVFLGISGEMGAFTGKTHLLVMVGTHNINNVVMIGNLPVYMKESDSSIYDLFQSIKAQNNSMRFADLLSGYGEATPYSSFDITKPRVAYVSEEGNSFEARNAREVQDLMNNAFDDSMYEEKPTQEEMVEPKKKHSYYITSEVRVMMDKLCQEIKEVMDYINDQYGTQMIEICTNSVTAQKYMCDRLSGIYRINDRLKIPETINVGDTIIDLSATKELGIEFAGCIGNLICDIKKGADFYA